MNWLKSLLVVILLSTETITAQELIFNKDSLYFYENTLADTVKAINTGSNKLLIDTVYSTHYYGYRLEILYKDSRHYHNIYDPRETIDFELEPNDTATFIFYLPDLCPICKRSGIDHFQDTIVVHSNSRSSSYSYLFAAGYGLLSSDENQIPEEFVLSQNYPNPFNPSTTINYQLPSASYVTLKVYDVLGRVVATLIDEYKQAGEYSVEFRVQNVELASGVYFCTLRVRDFSPDRSGSEFRETKKMLLIK